MKVVFVNIAVVFLIVGAALGIYWVNSDLSQSTTVAYGMSIPDGQGLAFYAPDNTSGGTTTFYVSYLYADSNASISLYTCPAGLGPSCDSTTGGTLLTTTSGATSITGQNGQGTYVEPAGPKNWYVVITNEPLIVVIRVPESILALAVEGSSIGLLVGGVALIVAGFVLKDPRARPTPRLAQLKRTLYFFFQNKLAVVGLAILIFFILVAVLAPLLAPFAPTYYTATNNQANADAYHLPTYCTISATPPLPGFSWPLPPCVNPQPVCTAQPCVGGDVVTPPNTLYANVLAPTWSYTNPINPGPLPLGSMVVLISSGSTGTYINIYQGLIRGAPWDLALSSVIVLSGALIGIFLGSLAGYMGGLVDEAVMRITDVFLSIPALLLTIVILISVTASNPSTQIQTILTLLVMSFIVTWWPGYTRLVRGQVLVTREQKYVEAARASGASTGRILRSHIIPNSIYPVFVSISLDVGTVPLLLGGLAFLGFNQAIGFGAPIGGLPTFPEWGSLAATGVSQDFIQNLITGASGSSAVPFPWWQFFFPGLVLFMFAIAVNFLSDGLRDALDPRLRR
jgi:peptide/nickel transport system permease protein